MAGKDNLTPWKPGQSGNPNGAPMLWETHEELYKKYSLMPIDELKKIDLTKIPIKHAIIINDLRNASTGRDKSIDRFHNRTDGKALERRDVTSGGEKIEANKIIFENFSDATKGK